MTLHPEGTTLVQPRLPDFDVRLTPPDLAPWIPGNIGIPGFTTFTAPEPGPHVAVLAITHGNEIAGAIVLDRLLREGIRPLRGSLTLGFANLAAFARFDPAQPTASRFLDEDLNRVWDREMLEGPRETCELGRARQIRPLIDRVDILLDLHSMLWPSDPLMLCGSTEKGRRLAALTEAPDLVVADRGHVSGRRLIDYGPFADDSVPQAANLIEAGQHWLPDTVGMTEDVTLSLLTATGTIAPKTGGAGTIRGVKTKGGGVKAAGLGPRTIATSAAPASHRRIAEVTHAITAVTASFAFVQGFRGGDVIARRNTLIAMDGTTEIRTPHDDCLLVMPSLRPSRGHTAVRLARFVDESNAR